MTWSSRFRARQYARGSLWIVPLLGALLGAVLGAAGVLLEEHVDISAWWHYSPSTASTVLSAIVGSTAALIGFVVTVTVLVVQMATGTFSARYMRLWYRDRMLKAVLALPIGTLAFSFQLLRHVESDFVPNIGVTVAGFLLLASLLVFMLYLDRVLHRMRPVAVAALVGEAGRNAFVDAVRWAGSPDAPDFVRGRFDAGGEPALRVRSTARGRSRRSTARASSAGPAGTGASSCSRTSSATSSRSGRPWSRSTASRRTGRKAGCAGWSPSGPSGRSSRIPRSRSGSWSTSRTSRCRPR